MNCCNKPNYRIRKNGKVIEHVCLNCGNVKLLNSIFNKIQKQYFANKIFILMHTILT